ncbi:hypothetical protein J3R83DRAFT_3252 [Lanmaoa asiatica]|nr:hypothetical protein J3R83DRAFT_3252 [Lanmaoa asiatica]
MEATNEGHDAFLRYHRDHSEEDLESSVAHFERALANCPDEHSCRAASLFNLAKAEFLTYRSHGTSHNFDRSISHYQEALESRIGVHQDRPMTLLHLSQVLLYHYGESGYETSTKVELRKLVDELMDICPEGTHERRAAELVLQTYKRLGLSDTYDLAELDELISALDAAAQEPPDAYFDRPIRFNNLGLALKRRFQLCGDVHDLDRAIEWLEKTVQITPNSHPEKTSYLSNLGNALLIRFQRQHVVPLTKQL